MVRLDSTYDSETMEVRSHPCSGSLWVHIHHNCTGTQTSNKRLWAKHCSYSDTLSNQRLSFGSIRQSFASLLARTADFMGLHLVLSLEILVLFVYSVGAINPRGCEVYPPHIYGKRVLKSSCYFLIFIIGPLLLVCQSIQKLQMLG